MSGAAITRAVEELQAHGSGTGGAPAGVAAALSAGALDVVAVAGSRTVATGAVEAAPLTASTHHDLASVTKVVTAAAIMRLVGAGQIELDEPVWRFIPSFAAGGKEPITVRDLLLHRAGLWEWYPLYLAGRGGDAEALLDSLPLRYPTGTARHYSDLGFIVLGRLVAAVTSLPLDDAITELVSGPLAMADTSFAAPVDDDVAMSAFDDRVEWTMIDTGEPYPVPLRSTDFSGWRHAPIVGEVDDGNAFHAFGGVAGHAGLFSTLGDLVRLAAALGDLDAGHGLWPREVATEFFAPGPDAGQALGFRRSVLDIEGDAVDLVGHTGFVGCAVGFVPGAGVALAMATNRLVTNGVPASTDELWQRIIEAAGAELASTRTWRRS